MVSKTLESIRKWAWLALIIAVVICAFLFIRNLQNSAAYKVEKRVFEEKLKESEDTITKERAEKQKAIDKAKEHEAKARKAEAEADKAAAERESYKAELARKARENRELKAKVEAMPADEIVSETRAQLEVSEQDIYRNALGVQFSLMASRKNLGKLYDAALFKTYESDFKKVTDSYEEEVAKLRLGLAEKDKAIAKKDVAIERGEKIEVAYEEIKINYADILKKSEKQARWLKFTIGGVAVTVTVAVIYFLLERKK